MKKLRIAVVGDNCVDKFLAPVNLSLLGGNALNVVVQLALLGHEAFYFGAVGPDADGARTRDILTANGVNIEHMTECQGNTAHTDITTLANGERVFLFEDFGVCAGYRPSDEDIAALKAMDHVHIGWLDDGGALRRTLASGGVSVSQDISVNADPVNLGVDGLTIAFASAGDDMDLAERTATELLDCGAKIAVATCGGSGSYVATRTITARTGIKPVNVIDTTGAGDSFIAGFLSVYLSDNNLQAAIECGRDRAALTCSHVGGFPQQPLAL